MARLKLTRLQILIAVLILVVPAAIVGGLRLMLRDNTPPDLAGGASSLRPEPLQVVPGIYLLGKSSPGAAYAVDTSDGLVLIDSGLDASGVIKQLFELGLDPARVKAVLVTHVHGDHSLGAERFREEFGSRIYAGQADCPPLRAGGPRDAFFSIYQMPNVALHSTTVDVELIGGETIQIGDTHFEAIAAPGHTPGSICYLLERRGLRVLFAGDVIQALNPTTKNVLGTYAAYLPPRYRGNAADYLATLRRLREMPTPHLVLPGHPGMDAEPQNPEIGVDRWLQLLDAGIADMEKLNARLETDGASFLDGVPKRLLPNLFYLGDLNATAVYCVLTEEGLLIFDAPQPRLEQFVMERLQTLGVKGRKIAATILTDTSPETTRGLQEFVRATHCKVVAPEGGRDAIRMLCPQGTEVLTPSELIQFRPLEVRPIPLGGRAQARSPMSSNGLEKRS